jgi:hypothetical protein
MPLIHRRLHQIYHRKSPFSPSLSSINYPYTSSLSPVLSPMTPLTLDLPLSHLMLSLPHLFRWLTRLSLVFFAYEESPFLSTISPNPSTLLPHLLSPGLFAIPLAVSRSLPHHPYYSWRTWVRPVTHDAVLTLGFPFSPLSTLYKTEHAPRPLCFGLSCAKK